MRLRSDQLAAALKKRLSPIYLLTGDEPLQLGEAADAIRQAAREAGYGSREIFHAEGSFNWSDLLQEADSLSLFADRKVLDMRLPSGRPGTEGAKALVEYTERLPEDTVLLISAGKVASAVTKAQWFKAIERVGVVVQVWPLEGQDLLGWLERRMRSRGLSTDRAGLQILAARIEGNLLAAAQEIDKLFVLKGSGHIDADTITDVVLNSSRYDVFGLVDSVLMGKPGRAARILAGLKAEDTAPAVVLWALAREVRLLVRIAEHRDRGGSQEAAFKQFKVWDKRKAFLGRALGRLTSARLREILRLCAHADRTIKGMDKGADPWELLLSVSMKLAGVPI